MQNFFCQNNGFKGSNLCKTQAFQEVADSYPNSVVSCFFSPTVFENPDEFLGACQREEVVFFPLKLLDFLWILLRFIHCLIQSC